MRFAAALAGHGLPWPAFCIGFSFWGSPPCFPRSPAPLLPYSPYFPLARLCAPLLSFRPAFPRRLFGPRQPFSSVPVGVRLSPRPLPPASGFLAPALARGFLPCLPAFRFHSRSPFRLYPPSLLAFYFPFQLSRPPFSSLILGRGSCFPSALHSACTQPPFLPPFSLLLSLAAAPFSPLPTLFQPAAGIRKHIVQPGKMCYTIPMNIHGLVPRTSIAEKGARRR